MSDTNLKAENSLPYQTTAQSGVTLMEIIAALAIVAIIIIGSLALYNAATSSQSSTQLVQDLTSVRSAVKQMWLGQGAYGATGGTSLNATLNSSKRMPNTLKWNTTNFTHVLNGTLSVTGLPTSFTIVVTNISPDVCMTLLANTTGWSSVQVGTGTAITAFPIAPATAATNCTATSNITFTSL